VIGGWRKLDNVELHNLYSLSIIITMMKSGGHGVQMGEKKNTYMPLVGNPKGKRSLRRPTHWWVNNTISNFSRRAQLHRVRFIMVLDILQSCDTIMDLGSHMLRLDKVELSLWSPLG
jgi:hypothetical protein